MKNTFVLLAAISLFVLFGCDTTQPTELKAEPMTLTELTTAPGYSWFSAEMSNYTPRESDVKEIAQSLQDNPNRSVCIFVRPTCACRGTQRLFPQIVKSLLAANVDSKRIEIWSMRAVADQHPYESRLTITELPSIYVFDGTSVRNKVSDSEYLETNASELIAKALR